jgi:cysteinyl-tRNA synthetase
MDRTAALKNYLRGRLGKVLTIGLMDFLSLSCSRKKNGVLDENVNYREKMRKFVGRISAQAKSTRPNFAVIPQNGLPILTQNGEPEGPIAEAYLQAIDGVGCEELLCGYEGDDKPTSAEMTQFWKGFLDLVKSHGKQALIIDYCRT